MKRLTDMSLEELWHMFPIYLEEHNNAWAQWYIEEKNNILSLVGNDNIEKIHHIGSTAVTGILAKPIIDILIEVKECNFQKVVNILKKSEWICMSERDCRTSFNKGYEIQGFSKKVFHMHIRLIGDCDEIYFRNYLIKNPKIAKSYEEMKIALSKVYKYDRDKYKNAKKDFVAEYTKVEKDFSN